MILDFKAFNENMSDIFRSAHGSIDADNLIPISRLVGKSRMPTAEELEAAAEFIQGDPEKFFYNPGDFLNSIIYWDGPLFYGFPGSISLEVLKMMRVDKVLERIQGAWEEAKRTKNYKKLFNFVEKKILIPFFVEIYDKIPDSQKYDIFKDLYVRSEYGFDMIPKKILQDCFEKRTLSTEWKKRIESLKKKAKDGKLTVYRGVGTQSAEKDALSWTLSKKTAKFFSNRFGGNGKILTKEIPLEKAMDYIEDRGESEVLIKESSKPYPFAI